MITQSWRRCTWITCLSINSFFSIRYRLFFIVYIFSSLSVCRDPVARLVDGFLCEGGLTDGFAADRRAEWLGNLLPLAPSSDALFAESPCNCILSLRMALRSPLFVLSVVANLSNHFLDKEYSFLNFSTHLPCCKKYLFMLHDPKVNSFLNYIMFWGVKNVAGRK